MGWNLLIFAISLVTLHQIISIKTALIIDETSQCLTGISHRTECVLYTVPLGGKIIVAELLVPYHLNNWVDDC